ncbi:branched-chain amino acid ABC transporter substrate-binding protein [Castellaniella sp. MT123]|uniref:branched-chain amino acid ABC transporter substrate-binding protein n=1 Tax=Castellaniella sp. MT123 TaxID=3140381 RepID=UPI0031F459F0
MLKHKEIIIGAALLLASPLSFGQTTVIKIGHIGPLTGPQAVIGKDNENGVRMAIEQLNAKGLNVAGKSVQFELDSQDDQADPRQGVTAAQKLVDDGVVAVIGPYNSGVAIPASKVFAQAEIPVLTVASNPTVTQQGYKNIVRVGANDGQLGGRMAEYAYEQLHARTAAVVDDRTAYGKGVADEFEKVAEKLGFKVVGREYSNDKAVDFRAILTKIKPLRPDVIFYGGYAAQGAPLVKQARQLAMRVKVLGGDGICSPDMGKVAGAAASDVFCAQSGASLDASDAGRDFSQQYLSKFKTQTQIFGVNFYDAMMLVAEAIQKEGSTDPHKIRAYLASARYKGVAGNYAFTTEGDLKGAPTTVYTFVDGQIKPAVRATQQPRGGLAAN